MLFDTPTRPSTDVADASWQYTVGTPDEQQPDLNSEPHLHSLGDEQDVPECFRTLLRNLPWPGSGLTRRLTTLGVTSFYRGEGVSTIAAQTALAAAAAGSYRVLLVDGNLAAPAVHRVFRQDLSPGLADVVLDHHPLPAAIRRTGEHLAVLTAGCGEPARVYEPAARWTSILNSLKQNFDLVVFDLPATSEANSAWHLFGMFDGVVLVVEHERVRWEAAYQKRQTLLRANANVLGVAFNKRTEHIPAWLYRTL